MSTTLRPKAFKPDPCPNQLSQFKNPRCFENKDEDSGPLHIFLLHASRLQKSRDLFRTFLSHYRPLQCVLRDIRNSYHAQSVLQAFKLQRLLQQSLDRNNLEVASASLPAVKVIQGLATLSSLEQRLLVLLSLLDSQCVVITGMTEILKTLEEAIEEEKVEKEESYESRKQLIPEMNNLRENIQQHETIQPEPSNEAEESSPVPDSNILNDPVALRKAIEQNRIGLTEISTKLINWEANYADVVPAQEYTSLLEVADQNDKIHAKEGAKLDAVLEIFNTFQNQANEAVADRNDFDEIHEELKNKATPRPSWSILAKHIHKSAEEEESEQTGNMWTSTSETLHLAVELLTGRKSGSGTTKAISSDQLDSEATVQLTAMDGTRFNGLVRRDAALLVQEVLEARKIELQGAAKIDKPPSTFQTFFDDFITRRFPWKTIRSEATGNLRAANERFGSTQPFLSLVEQVLHFRKAENVLFDWYDEIAQVQAYLKQESLKGDFPPGSMSYSALMKSMDHWFPNRKQSEIEALAKSASPGGMDAGWYFVQLEGLFAITDEGYTTKFTHQLIQTHEAERLSVVQSILQVLVSDLGVSMESALREGDPTGETDVAAQKLVSALTSNQSLGQEKLAAVLCWTYFTEIILPYTPSRGQHLLRHIQDNVRNSIASEDGTDDLEDTEEDQALEAAVQEIIGFNLNDSQENLRVNSRKRLLLPLKTVIERLQGCPLSWLQETPSG